MQIYQVIILTNTISPYICVVNSPINIIKLKLLIAIKFYNAGKKGVSGEREVQASTAARRHNFPLKIRQLVYFVNKSSYLRLAHHTCYQVSNICVRIRAFST